MFRRGTTAQAGDEFDRLFCALLPRLYRRARLLAGEWDAEDVVHEAYLKLAARPQRFLTHPEPYAYAFTALVSVLRNGRRREQGCSLVTLATEETSARADSGINGREAELEVVRLLAKLSKRQAAAVLLVDLDGYTIDEAAEILGVHRGTVSRARSRALNLLYTALDRETARNAE